MGDADAAQNIFDDNLEDLINEVLLEVDLEMNRLHSFISFLHARTCIVVYLMNILAKFRSCFAAFSLFVIPVVLSVGLSYLTTGLVTPGSTLEVAMEALVMISMYVSAVIGLPYYIFTLWELCMTDNKMEEFIDQSVNETDYIEGSNLTLDDIEESLETIGQFRALSIMRFQDDPGNSSDTNSEEEQQVGGNPGEEARSSTSPDNMPASRKCIEIRLSQLQVLYTDSDDYDSDSEMSLASQKPKSDSCLVGCREVDRQKRDRVSDSESIAGSCVVERQPLRTSVIRTIPIKDVSKTNSNKGLTLRTNEQFCL